MVDSELIVVPQPSGTELSSREVRSLSISNLEQARRGLVIDQQATIAARRLADPFLVAQTLVSHYGFAVNRGELRRARRLYTEIDDLVDSDLTRLGRPFYPTLLAVSGIATGLALDYVESERILKTGLAVAKSAKDPHADIPYLVNLGRNYNRQGRLSEAIELVTELQYRENVPVQARPIIKVRVAELFEMQGLWDQAADRFTALLGSGRTMRPRELIRLTTSLASLLALLGETDKAYRWIDVARSNAARLNWRLLTALVDEAEARIKLGVGDWEQAESLAYGAVNTNAHLGSSYAEMTSRKVLAQTFLQAGRPTEALIAIDDRRVSSLGPSQQARIVELRIDAHRQLGDWEMVVAEQNNFLEKTALVRDGLAELASATATGTNTELLREQRVSLADANKTLVAAQSEKTELLNIVAHDLKSPLTALELTLRFLAGAEGRTGISKIAAAEGMVARIQAITEQLSTLDELERGSAIFRLVETNVEPIVERVVQQYELVAHNKSISLAFHRTTSSEPLTAWVDEAQLEQVLENLISNALKYSTSGRSVDVTCAVGTSGSTKAQLEVSVVDNGLGLSADDLKGLFAKYSRLSSRPTAGESSSGLGLYIARSIARAMGGEISADSQGKGLGSTFVLSLSTTRPAPRQRSTETIDA